ncbi:hypothetical protein ACXFC0_003985 [Shigella flexneri]
MTDKDLYGGLIRLHILHHAAEEPVFGLGIIEELRGSVAKIVKLEHAWRRLDGRNDDGFQVAPFPG